MNLLTYICVSICIAYVSATIYTAQNVPIGQLPPPLDETFTDANLIMVGAGSGGSLTASLLSQTNCMKIIVLDDGFTINLNDSSVGRGVVPGTEDNGYYHPGLEISALIQPNPAVNGFNQQSYGASWRDIRGGDMRLSHYAIEAGSSEIHRKNFYEPYGQPPEWSPEYLWGHIMNNVLNFSGPNITGNHQNLGKIRAQQSRESQWANYWLKACSNFTSVPINLDFNTLNGSLNSCGTEPSNVRTDGLRSITEFEYLIPEATNNPNLILIRDTKVNRIIFDKTLSECKQGEVPKAIGVEGTFRNMPFTLLFRKKSFKGNDSSNCRKHSEVAYNLEKYQKVVVSTGTIPTPQLLMLSGIGNSTMLNTFNIPLVANIPAVGQRLKEGSVTFMGYYAFNATALDIYGGNYPNNSDKIVSRPGAFFNATYNDQQSTSKFLLWTPVNYGSPDEPFVVGYALPFELTQELEGSVTLITPNMADLPKVDYGWDQTTLQKHVNTMRLFRNIIYNGSADGQSIADRFGLVEFFPGLDVQDDAGLANAASIGIQAILHASGTTRFARNNDPLDGVVNLDFDVLQTKNLKIGGMSVFPYFTGAGGQFQTLAVSWNLQNKIRKEIGFDQL